jgi:hypothetical protein
MMRVVTLQRLSPISVFRSAPTSMRQESALVFLAKIGSHETRNTVDNGKS